MNTVAADYNSMTEAGHVRLTLPCSQKDIQKLNLRPGDWAWLSDSEVVVGAQLAVDDRYGPVGVPDWAALARLDDEGAADVDRIKTELSALLSKQTPSVVDEPRILELLIQLEYSSPQNVGIEPPGTLEFRRALALRQMGKLGLALLEMKEARRNRPHDPMFDFVYLDLLRLEQMPTAVLEAQRIAETPDVTALVLSACISILTMRAEQVSGEEFDLIAEQVLAWCRRFDDAPDLHDAGPSLVALTFFNRGFVHLRSGRISLARQAFKSAQEHYPVGPMLDEVTGLQPYDRHARDVAERVRTAIAEQVPAEPVAA